MSRSDQAGRSAPAWLLAGLLILIGGGAGFLLWPTEGGVEDASTPPVATVAAPSVGALTSEPPASETPTGRVLAGDDPASDTTIPSATADRPARVIGRVVDDQGSAVAAQLTLRPVQNAAPVANDRFTTAADGSFAVELPPLRAVELELRAPGWAAAVAPIGRAAAGVELSIGTVVLSRGRRVVGRVLDENGKPVEDVLVEARRDVFGSELKRASRPVRVLQTRTGLGGGFVFADPLPPGKWSLNVADRVFHVEPTPLGARSKKNANQVASQPASQPGRIVVEVDPRDLVVELVVKPIDGARLLAGTVCDEAGQPIGRARVTAFVADGSRVGSATADASGRFELRLGGNQPDLHVRLRAELTGFEGELTQEEYAPGNREARVFLRRGAALAVHVVDDQGAPVERFALHVFPTHTKDVAELRARSEGRHDHGVALAHGLHDGEHAVFVATPLGHLVQAGLQRVHLHGAAARVDVVMSAPAHRRVRALKHGEPAETVAVELLAPLDDAPIHRESPAAKLIDLWKLGERRVLRVLTGLTDRNGELSIVGHPQQRYWLRLRPPGGVATLREVVLGSEGDVIEVPMAVGAVVEGQLQPAEFVAQVRKVSSGPPRLQLIGKLDNRELQRDTLRPIGDDGRFVFTDVPAGDWQLRIDWLHTGSPVNLAKAPVAPLRLDPVGDPTTDLLAQRHDPNLVSPNSVKRVYDLAPVVGLADGERRTVALSAHAYLHAHVRVSLRDGDKPWLGGVWFTEEGVEGRKPHEFVVQSRDDGVVEILLPAGSWRCDVSRTSVPRQTVGTGARVFAGQSASMQYSIDLLPVRLRLRDADGRAIEKAIVSVRREGGQAIALPSTDKDGRVVVRLAAGRYFATHGEHELLPFDVPAPNLVELAKPK